MHNLILILIIAIPVAGYLTERYLNYLNSKMWSPELPDRLKGICDENEYRKTQFYQKDNNRLSLWSSTFNLVILLLMIISGGFAFVDNLVRSITSHPVLMSLMFFGIIGLATDLLNIPFSYYDNFVIEKKYGFNTMTIRTFITDHIKSWILALVIGAPVLALITWFYYKTGKSFWIYAWILITVFTIFINFFYSELIVPLFNKQTPLQEGSLRTKIEEFASKTDFHLSNIYIIDGSKRSTKANAYFSGFGSKKRIVLYDTLLKELEEDEIVAVLAHETGHYKRKHIIHNMLVSILLTGLTLFLFSLVVDSPALSKALGAEYASFHLGLLVFGILYSPLSLVIGLIANYISRKNELQADAFVKKYNYAVPLSEALKKLSVKNLSNMNPHPVYVFFHYSHPPLLERLKKLE
ncbi:MAG TPA: M48 family metallopeptidase [Bacteroidales bacterium]|nr:M48 family metallopeptidase [Bacteroidales bacterium]HOK75468.1 M48 family metallopeptidase [Bacteroidales bacterium]HOM39639.1 M48 family metallopeptidase [Bacteroidales bacterium]HPP91613.1 M48 family metallopeptidase [Bacteroidales bacterium]HQK71881.1 M48 family metallopeptidase [Bacteroidales bacterium]